MTYRKFNKSPKKLIPQLRLCDEARISGQTVDLDLEGNWGVDMVRKLQHWDIPGYLSRNAFPILQALGDMYGRMPVAFTMEYAAVISGEDDLVDTWRAKYDSATWTDGWPHSTWSNERNEISTMSINVGEGVLVTIPMYAEGFTCYLVLWVRHALVVNKSVPIQPASQLQ
mgnify:CR=1 FL=1